MKFSIFFIFVAIAIVIAFCGFYFSKKAKIKRKLKNTPLKRISDFKNNETAKIIGQVQIVDKPLIAPLSKRECAHYHVIVERKVSTGKNSHWKTIIEEEVGHQLLIKDGDDYAYLDDRNTKSYIVQDEKFTSGFGNDATENLESYLKSKGEESEGFLGFNKTIRYYEGILEDQEKIAISGKGKWTKTNELQLNLETDRVLVLSSETNRPVYLTDDTDATVQTISEAKRTTKTTTSSFNNRKS